jgi:hypothetical protein
MNSNKKRRRVTRDKKKLAPEDFEEFADLSLRMSSAWNPNDSEMLGSDVVLIVKDERFYAHRFILAGSSRPFQAMLAGSMREAKEHEVHINDVHPRCFQMMLQFIYTGVVRLHTETVIGIMLIADQYEIFKLRDLCMRYMEKHAQVVLRPHSGETAGGEGGAAEGATRGAAADGAGGGGGGKDSSDSAYSDGTCSDSSYRGESFGRIPESHFIELLRSDELNIREIDLFEAVLEWGGEQMHCRGLRSLAEAVQEVQYLLIVLQSINRRQCMR